MRKPMGRAKGRFARPVYQSAYKPRPRFADWAGTVMTVVLFVYLFVWCFPEGFQK